VQGYNVGDTVFCRPDTICPFWFSSRFLFYPHRGFLFFFLLACLTILSGCMGTLSHYSRIEASLRNGNPEQADLFLASQEDVYGSKNRLLYLMDRGMTLHLAGHYAESTKFLEEADHLVESLYTRRLRNEAVSFLVNDTLRPFRGDPYEQVMVNVIKALNFAALGELNESLVEARKIDHRLNVLSDEVEDIGYREDPFARYLTGMLYEATGDWNNAFIAYHKAYQGYESARPWLHVPLPHGLKQSLLRTTKLLHLSAEHAEYQRLFSGITNSPAFSSQKAHVVVLGMFGHAPRVEDQFLDVPISAQALGLVLQTKRVVQKNTEPAARGVESLLYGLQGQVVRVALPTLVPQRSQVSYGILYVKGDDSSPGYQTELVNDMTATAKKNFDDQYPRILARTVARVAL